MNAATATPPSPLPTSSAPDPADSPEKSGATPKALLEEMTQTLRDAEGEVLGRMQVAHDTARCLWDGQSDDGRKREAELGVDPFPWEGASDSRIKLAEEVIDERTLLMKAAFYRAKMQASPRESGDTEAAVAMTAVLGYATTVQMGAELSGQVETFTDYQETYGSAVFSVKWLRLNERYSVHYTVDDLVAMAVESGHAAALAQGATPEQAGQVAAIAEDQIRDLLLSEEHREVLRGLIGGAVSADGGSVTPSDLAQAARTLAAKGEVDVIATREGQSRPRWRALLPFVDVFFPLDTECMEDARWVAEVVWMDLATLRSRAAAEGWDKKWLRKVEAHPGRALDPASWMDRHSHPWALSGTGVGSLSFDESETKLYQVLEVHYRVAPEGSDGALIRRAVLHGAVNDRAAVDEPSPDRHGAMPFVDGRHERRQQVLLASRGVPERILTEQVEIKVQRDARADGTTLATLPPVEVPFSRMGASVKIKPLAQIGNPNRPNGKIGWFDPPPADGFARAAEVEEAVRAGVNRLFRRESEHVPPTLSQLEQQDVVDRFLGVLTRAARLTAALLQQYMSPVKATRVVGYPIALDATRDSIQGEFDLELSFDARDLNTEFVAKKLDAIGSLVLPMDSDGTIDRSGVAAYAMQSIDPRLAATVVRDPGATAAKEIEEEQKALTQILAGLEPIMVEGGQNHALRLQYLQQSWAENPSVQQKVAADPNVASIFQNRLAHHRHQVEQQQNAVIGRLGAGGAGVPGPNLLR